MGHIDEGTLHALLDGALRGMEPERAESVQAHLESCAECRARAEEAAALRGRTDEILGVLEPSVTPDFDEVLVRAGATAKAPTGLLRQHRWTRGLAWAATIVIALGTGYLIRDQVVPGPAAEVTSSEAADRAASPGQAADRTPEPRQAADGGGAEAGPGLAEAQPEPRSGSEGREPIATAPEPSAPAVAAADRPRAQEPAEEQPQEQTERQPQELARDQPQQPPVAADVAAQEPLEVEELREETARMAVESRERLEAASLTRANEGQASALAADVLVLPGDTLTSFRDAEPAAVAELAGAPLMVLPGAEVLRAQVGQRGADSVIVSVQRLEGLELRVTQRPATIALEAIIVTGAPEPGADEAADATEADGSPLGRPVAPEALSLMPQAEAVSRVRVPASLGWELVLEGALPREALEALARAARPYQPEPEQQ